jgi:hypothetical protein
VVRTVAWWAVSRGGLVGGEDGLCYIMVGSPLHYGGVSAGLGWKEEDGGLPHACKRMHACHTLAKEFMLPTSLQKEFIGLELWRTASQPVWVISGLCVGG